MGVANYLCKAIFFTMNRHNDNFKVYIQIKGKFIILSLPDCRIFENYALGGTKFEDSDCDRN